MKYLTKEIEKIFLLDFFTSHERTQDGFQVTRPLEEFLSNHNLPYQTKNIDSREEVWVQLTSIRDSNLGSGAIIHFICHGATSETGFGNNTFIIQWQEIAHILAEINQRCNNGLIINTSCMCYGTGIFSILNEPERPFYAAIAAIGTSSLQAWMHNKEVYTKCVRKDIAEKWLQVINNGLEAAENEQRYMLVYG